MELTKTKESLDRCEEEMSHISSELERVTEAKQKLEMQHKNSEMELIKLQTVGCWFVQFNWTECVAFLMAARIRAPGASCPVNSLNW